MPTCALWAPCRVEDDGAAANAPLSSISDNVRMRSDGRRRDDASVHRGCGRAAGKAPPRSAHSERRRLDECTRWTCRLWQASVVVVLAFTLVRAILARSMDGREIIGGPWPARPSDRDANPDLSHARPPGAGRELAAWMRERHDRAPDAVCN